MEPILGEAKAPIKPIKAVTSINKKVDQAKEEAAELNTSQRTSARVAMVPRTCSTIRKEVDIKTGVATLLEIR